MTSYSASDIADRIEGAAGVSSPGQPQPPGAEWLYLRYLNRAHAMAVSRYADSASIDSAMRGACRLTFGPAQLRAHHDRDVLARWSKNLDAEIDGNARNRSYSAPNTHPAGDDEQVEPMSVRSVGIVGTGIMATGITQTYLAAGIDVSVASRSTESSAKFSANLDRALTRQRIDDNTRAAITDRVHVAEGYGHLRTCDLVIECVAENFTTKTAVFCALDRLCPSTTVLATTTSSLQICDIAAFTDTPTRVIGMHFFNPANTMPLIELIATHKSAPRTITIAENAAKLAGKEVVRCGDRPGFIVNALLIPYLNDALRVLRTTRNAPDLDCTMRRFGFPMGPVALLELIGLDVALTIQHTLKAAFGDDESVPDPLLAALVENNILGRKNRTTVAEFLAAATPATDVSRRSVNSL
ncbi:hypothetical protein BJD99_01380 [Rhodococcus sp. 1163]|nr:hypothetical protein BJD99_01380 [Rhodococcus sp. 1163]